VVINAVVVPAGADDPGAAGWEWRAVDGEVLLAQVRTAGHVGAAVLRRELSARRDIAWEPAGSVAEIAGFPADLLAAFSTRRGEVTAEFTQLVAAGLEPSGATVAAAQLRSRAPKRVLADAEVAAIQHGRPAAAGWTPGQVRQLAPALADRPVPRDPLGEGDIAGLFARLAGASGLTAQATTFTRGDVIRQVAVWAGDRLGAEDIERLTDRFLADRRVVVLHSATRARRRHEPEPLYATESLLAAEDTVLALVGQGRVAAGAAPRRLVDRELLDAHLAAATRPAPGATGPVLSVEQADLVRGLLTSGDLVRLAVGPAGTGKTEAMRTLTAILTAAGRPVLATAHGGRQAEELAERIGIPARVVAGWLTLLDRVDDAAAVWPAGSVLIVDEATQVATRDAERLLRYATRTGTVVILLGDPAQLGSVGAGGWFAHLAAATPDAPALTTVRRQAGAEMAPVRAALDALRAEAAPPVRAALDRLAEVGHVHLADTADALLERAVADWYTERRHHLTATRTTHAPTHTDLDGADRAAPRAAPTTARLPAADGANPAGGAAARADPAGAGGAAFGPGEDAVPEENALVDDPARPTGAGGPGNEPGRGGHTLQVYAPTRGPALVHLMAERTRDVDALNAAARTLLTADATLSGPVLSAAGRDFQAGDEVVTLTQAGHTLVPAGRPASAYIRTGTIGVVTAVHLDDNPHAQALDVHFPSRGSVRIPWEYLTHHFGDGRRGGLGHAYALTAAKAQGSTLETAWAVVPDDTSRPGLYVMLSRARTDLHAYVVHRADLDHRDDDESWLPAGPDPDSPLDRLADHLARSRPDRLAADHDPAAAAVHRLRLAHNLADLAAVRLAADNQPATPGGGLPGHDTAATSEPADPRVDDTSRSSRAPAHPSAPTRADAPPGAPASPATGRTGPTPPRADKGPGTPASVAAAAGAPVAPPGSPDAPDPAPAEHAASARSAPPDATSAPPRASEGAGLPRQVLLRRAELAAEAMLRATAVHDLPPGLLARIGARPASGPDRATWDDAVTALAIYHARHQPDAEPHGLGPPPGAGADDRRRDPWLLRHDQATRHADAWAATLPDQARARFHSALEAIPRRRAVAGLHALLEHGHHPDQLHTALTANPPTGIRTGAPVLAQRVADLTAAAGVDADLYDLPAPATAQQEWNSATRLLDTAEVTHLATCPTADLLTERRQLADQHRRPRPAVSPGAVSPTDPEAAARRARLDVALDHQTTRAFLRATAEPAGYLTDLLGPRPTTDPAAWDEAAHRIEHYRHHTLGHAGALGRGCHAGAQRSGHPARWQRRHRRAVPGRQPGLPGHAGGPGAAGAAHDAPGAGHRRRRRRDRRMDH